MPTLQELRGSRLPLILDGERCRITYITAGIPPVIITVKAAGMDYVAGVTDADARLVIPLSAIAFVEFPP